MFTASFYTTQQFTWGSQDPSFHIPSDHEGNITPSLHQHATLHTQFASCSPQHTPVFYPGNSVRFMKTQHTPVFYPANSLRFMQTQHTAIFYPGNSLRFMQTQHTSMFFPGNSLSFSYHPPQHIVPPDISLRVHTITEFTRRFPSSWAPNSIFNTLTRHSLIQPSKPSSVSMPPKSCHPENYYHLQVQVRIGSVCWLQTLWLLFYYSETSPSLISLTTYTGRLLTRPVDNFIILHSSGTTVHKTVSKTSTYGSCLYWAYATLNHDFLSEGTVGCELTTSPHLLLLTNIRI